MQLAENTGATSINTKKAKVVHFRVYYPCEYGASVLVCGSVDRLGNWDSEKAIPLTWTDSDVWAADIPIWSNKKHLTRPLLIGDDGPVPQMRRWYRQFYSENVVETRPIESGPRAVETKPDGSTRIGG